MTTKTTAPDADVAYYYYKPDLIIDPPLKDAVVKAYASNHLGLKQKKDEDVQMVDGEITVVSTNITTVTASVKANQYADGYDHLKRAFVDLVALVAANGSAITGQILVRRYGDFTPANEFFRLVPDGSKVKVEGAVLAFPDGTRLPVPAGEGLA